MSDTAARREARRRRILENSENRLRIISGLTKSDGSGDIEVKSDNDQTCSLPSLEQEKLKYKSNEQKPTDNSSLLNHDNESTSRETGNSASYADHFDKDRSSRDPSFVAKQRPLEGVLQEAEKSQSLVVLVLAARLHLIGLAFLVRLLFSSNFGFLFGESIFVPLFTVFLMKYFSIFSDPNNVGSDSGILSAALMLSGLPARQISILNKILGGMKNFLEDFYIYFFSFIVLHVSLEFIVY